MTDRKRAQLEWSRGWGDERPPFIVFVALVFFVVCGVGLMGPYANTYFQQGHALQGMLGVVAGLSALTVALGLIPALRVRRENLPRRLRVTTLSDGTVGLWIGVRPLWKPLMITCLILFGGMFVIRAILSGSNASQASNPAVSQIGIIGAFASILIAALVIYTLAYMFFGRRPYFLAITETGIIQAAGKAASTLKWDEITNIEPIRYARNHMVRIAATRRIGDIIEYDDRHELPSAIDVIPGQLNVDPPLLLALLRFYWRYPELRTELTSDAVIDRMRRADFRRPKTLGQDNKPTDRSPIQSRHTRGLDSSPGGDL